MEARRIEKQKYAADVKLGRGAFSLGGRWNSPGRATIYASQSTALAVLEILAHSPSPAERTVKRVRFDLTITDASIETVPRSTLPKEFGPATPYAFSQAIGDDWLQSARCVCLRVPSAIVTDEWNLMLNPLHPDFHRAVTWHGPKAIELDPRLWMV